MKLLNPAQQFANSAQDSRGRWIGYVWEWKSRTIFGKSRPNPFQVELYAYASHYAEAEALLAQQAESQGYALGGVFGIHQISANTLPRPKEDKVKSTPKAAPKKLSTEEKIWLSQQLEREIAALESL